MSARVVNDTVIGKFTNSFCIPIVPLPEGNGRMERMWHSLLLGKWKEMFFWLSIEELIQSRQKEYYDALGVADAQADRQDS